MEYQKMTSDKRVPGEYEILKFVGKNKHLWTMLKKYVEEHYPHKREITLEGKDKVVAIRYRKSGKTLITFYPEKNSFIALVILGKIEVEKVKPLIAELSRNVCSTFKDAEQYHDGRWLWIRPLIVSDIKSIETLLNIKRRPIKNE